MTNNSIDPRDERYALSGRIVTMNDAFDVINPGTIYIHNGAIAAVQPKDDAPPPGFESARVVNTRGTIYPGLIELHNHLSYNVLPMWKVPETFENRGQWRDHTDKRRLVTAPMAVLGRTPGYVEAIVRYVECKCLISGVTTSQGISLYGVRTSGYYRGIVRNVEASIDQRLPSASTKISDVTNVQSFWKKLQAEKGCLLLHLSEGVDAAALRFFNELKLPEDKWAMSDALAGIHAAALRREHFEIMKQHNAAMVWSPLSNLLLYGQTAKIDAALDAGLVVGLGSDWSPSGSKNLLCEMKVAALIAEANKFKLTPRDIVAMVTRNAAKILKWHNLLGSIEAGKQADLVVIDQTTGDPYETLVKATERDVDFVVIDGIPRYGRSSLMQKFVGETELFTVGGKARLLNLWEEFADPATAGLTLEAAAARLEEGMTNIVALAEQLENPADPVARLAASRMLFGSLEEAFAGIGMADELARGDIGDRIDRDKPPVFLDLHEDEFDGFGSHADAFVDGFALFARGAADPYSKILADVTITLDPLTVVDDKRYFGRIWEQMNLPGYIKNQLPAYYGVTPDLPEGLSILADKHEVVKTIFAAGVDLQDYLKTPGFLTKDEKRLLLQQSLLLLESVYVHLPMKRSMYAIDPVQRLRLLQFKLEEPDDDSSPETEMEFHRELLAIFTSLRDLHTNYCLPFPYRGKVALLPFLIEEYFIGTEPHYIVSKIIATEERGTFTKNVEVLYWNGIPIKRAIQLNADRQAGNNEAASFARGLDSLTIRPLTTSLPPDEEWVTLKYLNDLGTKEEITFRWRVYTLSQVQSLFASANNATATAVGLDWHANAIHQIKRDLFASEAAVADSKCKHTGKPQAVAEEYLPTHMPTVFRAKKLDDSCGYIRIFTFNVNDADTFVTEFVKLMNQLPKEGLIIDIRSNGGGLIYAAERLLQVLTPRRPIEPSRAQFINSQIILQLCRLHAPSTRYSDFTLSSWVESIRQSVRTGAFHSQGNYITDPVSCNDRTDIPYAGKKVLIVDAMCYSAADIFAAGFQDHNIGDIIGVADNSGAGGANVWGYGLLQDLMSDMAAGEQSVFKSLPHGADMRVAIRRTLRVGSEAGTPLEDLGVRLNRYRMTKDDLLKSNIDLLAHARAALQA